MPLVLLVHTTNMLAVRQLLEGDSAVSAIKDPDNYTSQ